MTLREYLRAYSASPIPEYDDFILKAWDLFELRGRAEDWFRLNSHLARSVRGALPLPWEQVKDVLDHGNRPPETVITRIAKQQYGIVFALAGSIRKVLVRVRKMTPIGKIEQLDTHCIRWMMQQSGRTPAEKAGSKQELLGVVRVENRNTLENRVLKAFLKKAQDYCKKYRERYGKEHSEHENVRSVARFEKLCLQCLSLPELADVGEQTVIPYPNYVLRQDNLYSRIWKSWCDLMRLADIVETLWERREEVKELYGKCRDSVSSHCSDYAKFYTPLWINEIKNDCQIFEEPIWENEQGENPVFEPQPPRSAIVIVDFSNPWDGRRELCIPKNHPNARPFLGNPHRPSQEPCDTVILEDILKERDEKALADWLRAFYGVCGGKRWIVLTPDSWDAVWLQKVMRAMPIAASEVFLLWRSIAAALAKSSSHTFHEGDKLWVADRLSDNGHFDEIQIVFKRDFASGRIIPQRASPRLHKERFRVNHSDPVSPNHLKITPQLLIKGVEHFLRCDDEGRVAYFDELDGLFVIVQTRFEEVKFETLVEHKECWPGGREYVGGNVTVGFLPAGMSRLELRFAVGERLDTTKLNGATVDFKNKIEKDMEINCHARITPGQGVGTLQCSASFIEKALFFSLDKCKETQDTKMSIEREIKRHFPPFTPLVQSSEELWQDVAYDVHRFLHNNNIPCFGLFAKADHKYEGPMDPKFNPETMSPLELLRRVNVFGNDEGHKMPDADIDWHRLFEKLTRYYLKGNKKFLRLIAWTYRCDEPAFEPIRDEIYKRYCKDKRPFETEQQATFCANCFDASDDRIVSILLQNIWRIKNGVSTSIDLRLLYNLLQFHPQITEVISTKDCNKVFDILRKKYSKIPLSNARQLGYHLKCLLFLLHRRRYDREFLKEYLEYKEGWQPGYNLGKQIEGETPSRRAHEETRKSLLAYLVGQGTIEGLICSMEHD